MTDWQYLERNGMMIMYRKIPLTDVWEISGISNYELIHAVERLLRTERAIYAETPNNTVITDWLRKAGYERVACIDDFYKVGVSKVTYRKLLNSKP